MRAIHVAVRQKATVRAAALLLTRRGPILTIADEARPGRSGLRRAVAARAAQALAPRVGRAGGSDRGPDDAAHG